MKEVLILVVMEDGLVLTIERYEDGDTFMS